MSWLPVILITLTFGAFLPQANAKAETKILFKNYELLEYFSEILVDQLISTGLLTNDQEQDAIDGLRELIYANQGKKVSTMKHAFGSKIADIIVEGLEGKDDATLYIESANTAIETALEETIGVVDENFLETINDMVSVMYNNDLEDKIEEEQEEILSESTQVSEQEQALQTTTTMTTTSNSQTTGTNAIQESISTDTNEIRNNNVINENSQFLEENNNQQNEASFDFTSQKQATEYDSEDIESSKIPEQLSYRNSQSEQTSQQAATSQVATQSYASQTAQTTSASQVSSASQVVSVNYQSVQSTISSNLQSSSVISSLSSGILSSSDIIQAIEGVLSSYGVQSGIVRRIASQYTAALRAGASSQTIIHILSSIVTQALQQSEIVKAGQESTIASNITVKLLNTLQSYTSSRSQPAPQSVFVQTPVYRPQPAAISSVQQQAYLNTASQQAATSQIGAQSSSSLSAQLLGSSESLLSDSASTSEITDSSTSYAGMGSTSFQADSSYNSGEISVSSGFSGNARSQTSIPSSKQQLPALSKASSQLTSPAAANRISSLSSSLSSAFSGGVDYASLSQALGNVASEIRGTSSLSQSEVLIEALLETLVALLQLIAPSPSGSNLIASQLAQSLVQVSA